MSNARAVGLSRLKISNITDIVRGVFGLEDELYFPVVQCIELMAADGEGFNVEIVEPSELENTYATTNTDEDTM